MSAAFYLKFAKTWPEILGGILGGAVKWFCIGALLHLGWRMVQ